MAVKTFAAIDVGSYELAMKIFEVSAKRGVREIDHIRHSIELGTDTYNTGKISFERADELCFVLNEFSKIMKSYKVDDYKAYGTSAIRETNNTKLILEQLKSRTGINVDVLSNSEQRFLNYKSIALKGAEFEKIIEEGTVIVDIGGGSIQLSLFDKDSLIATQNMRLGVLRMREKLQSLAHKTNTYDDLIDDMVHHQLSQFKKLYLKDRQIKNLIVTDDYISAIMQKSEICSDRIGYLSKKEFIKATEQIRTFEARTLAKDLGIPEEELSLLYHSAILIRCILEILEAEIIWAPGVSFCDGIAYEYVEKNSLMTFEHDFDKDILACSQNLSKRYAVSRKRSELIEEIALTIFDSMKKVHGLGKRERLLLQIAARLNDCGKYITLMNVGECSYNIIMATEIIGLSHKEREIVANAVKYNRVDFVYFEDLSKITSLDLDSYLVMAKLAAILRVSTGLDRSHKQKFKNVSAKVKDSQLIMTTDTVLDITFENGLLEGKARLFEEVFSIKPVIKQRKRLN